MAQQRQGNQNYPTDSPRQRVSAHYHQPYPQPLVYGPSVPQQQPARTRSIRLPARTRGARQRRVLMAGGSMLALATLVVTPSINRDGTAVNKASGEVCIKQVDKQSLVSRDELAAVLDLERQATKAQVQKIVDQPHCVLEAQAGENGVRVEREAYPLEFDPQTWFVLQYQDGKYAGFDFSFR